jgi:uracil-DNA glycosylase
VSAFFSTETQPSTPANVQIDESWKALLAEEFNAPYFSEIKAFLLQEKAAGKILYPPGALIFNAFNLTPVDDVRVVILGQDPYHNPGEAMGLCFSVPKKITIPASLRNIYKELQSDVGITPPSHGDLSSWASQGVLLLNAMLTVEHGKAGSHRNIGWQKFTDAVIRRLSEHRSGLIFLLWGNFARSKKTLIDQMKHDVLEAVHPSPLAGNAFLGCRHFSRVNEILSQQGLPKIDWNIS